MNHRWLPACHNVSGRLRSCFLLLFKVWGLWPLIFFKYCPHLDKNLWDPNSYPHDLEFSRS